MRFGYVITRPGVILLIGLAVAIIALLLVPKKEKKIVRKEEPVVKRERKPLDLNDEDATVASLVASIDYHEKIKKDVKVLSVRRIG